MTSNSNKPLGGRGYKAEHPTVTVRIPKSMREATMQLADLVRSDIWDGSREGLIYLMISAYQHETDHSQDQILTANQQEEIKTKKEAIELIELALNFTGNNTSGAKEQIAKALGLLYGEAALHLAEALLIPSNRGSQFRSKVEEARNLITD